MGGVSVEYLPGTWRTLSLHKNVTVYAKVVTHTRTLPRSRDLTIVWREIL